MSRIATYLSFVRFSHSVFALPFALTGALLAWRVQPFSWTQVTWIVVCMVSARSAAMGFNRLVDARFDALNPRTAMRELPRGAMSHIEATLFVAISSIVFVFASSTSCMPVRTSSSIAVTVCDRSLPDSAWRRRSACLE
jgi:4-hydroxybenzoate polyprenyltransferase